MEANRRLVLVGRQKLLDAIGGSALVPEGMIGSIAAVELPLDLSPAAQEMPVDAPAGATYPQDPMHDELLKRHSIEAPAYSWPHTPTRDVKRVRLIRVSRRRPTTSQRTTTAWPRPSWRC